MKTDYTKYTDFAVKTAKEILSIDSPTGFTEKVSAYASNLFSSLGCTVTVSNKGAVLAMLPCKASVESDGLLFEAHADTIGAMVSSISSQGRLMLTNIGGSKPCNLETENVRIYTRDNKCFEGTIQLKNASAHVNKELSSAERTFDSIEVVLDENVNSDKDVNKLGISVGDFVCPDPRTTVTASGYIKSRYLDDKLSVSCLAAVAKYFCDNDIKTDYPVYFLITTYEEVGHGGSSFIPSGVTEAISVDMGCVGEKIQCKETQVSICAKDSGGPYDYEITNRLIAAAKETIADYAIDVYPFYGSDVEATLRAGYDIRHGLIGPGVYASHGYERSHIDGVKNTIKVITGYIDNRYKL